MGISWDENGKKGGLKKGTRSCQGRHQTKDEEI